MKISPRRLLSALYDGDLSLRFDALYDFLEREKLEEKFVAFVKKEHFGLCGPDFPVSEAKAEWGRVIAEASKKNA